MAVMEATAKPGSILMAVLVAAEVKPTFSLAPMAAMAAMVLGLPPPTVEMEQMVAKVATVTMALLVVVATAAMAAVEVSFLTRWA